MCYVHTLLHSSTCTHLKGNFLDESGASAAADSCIQEALKISPQVKKEPESPFSNATTITTDKATSKKKKLPG